MLSLRPYQTDAIAACSIMFRAGHRRVLLCAPTGSGKTVIAAEIVRRTRAGQRWSVLFVTHRKEIHAQTVAKLRAAGLEPAELTAGRQWPAGAPLIAASSATLARRLAAGLELPERLLIVVDECHTQTTAHGRLLEHVPTARALLLTATPCRLDGAPLPADVIVECPNTAWLTAAGFLVPAVYVLAETPDLHGIPLHGDGGKLELAYNAPRLVGSVVDTWLEHAQGRRTVCFAAGCDHGRALCAAYLERGVRARFVSAESPTLERAAAFDALRAHMIDVLVNVGLVIEGVDIPEISCIQWARATDSLTIWLQGNGRGLRPGGSSDCLIIDHGGNAWRHGTVTQARVWSLTGKPTRGPLESLHTCSRCLAMWSGSSVCPRCGCAGVPTERPGPKTVDGAMVRVSAAELERRARAASRDVPPRDCPEWASADPGLWQGLERKRQREGYDLGDGSQWRGWTQATWRRIHGRA